MTKCFEPDVQCDDDLHCFGTITSVSWHRGLKPADILLRHGRNGTAGQIYVEASLVLVELCKEI